MRASRKKARIVSFHCVLKDPLGRVISSSFSHDVMTGGTGVESGPGPALPIQGLTGYPEFIEPLQDLMDGLKDLKAGEKRQIFVSADRAYGFYNPELVMEVPRRKMPHGEVLEIGFQVIAQGDNGESRVFRVVSADPLSVTLDGNHPLAGQDLFFNVEATACRDATPEEIALARRSSSEARESRLH